VAGLHRFLSVARRDYLALLSVQACPQEDHEAVPVAMSVAAIDQWYRSPLWSRMLVVLVVKALSLI
jgi:hypothetical protein